MFSIRLLWRVLLGVGGVSPVFLDVILVCWLFPRWLIFSLQCLNRNMFDHKSQIDRFNFTHWSNQTMKNEHTLPQHSPAPRRSSFHATRFCEGGWCTWWPPLWSTWWRSHSSEPRGFWRWSPPWLQRPTRWRDVRGNDRGGRGEHGMEGNYTF